MRSDRLGDAGSNPDTAYGDVNLGADCQQLQANRRALRALPVRAAQREPPQVMHQNVSDGGEVQPQLIAAHGSGAGAVGKKSHLLFLDPVFHLTARTVNISSNLRLTKG